MRAAVCSALMGTLLSAGGSAQEVRALWVTRWDYTSPEHVTAIMENAASLHFNVVLFQVRGNATAFYPSAIEPWAWELTGDDASSTGQDPGWDPLARAVEEAHARGLEIQAYMNVFPAWRSQDYPPRDSGQLWWTHPEWFMVDAAGHRMVPRDHRFTPYPDWYAFISPGVPEVQDHLGSVFEEVARNYEIDGIHFDYIRYPFEIHEVAEGYEERQRALGNWSYDPVSLRRFTEETGVETPDASPETWIDWRCQQITDTLRQIRERVDAVRPGIHLSAAVMPEPEDARRTKNQDYLRWLREGLLDSIQTMGYTSSNEVFARRLGALGAQFPARGWFVPGMSLGNDAGTVEAQIAIARETEGASGFAGFAYSHLFDRDNGHVRTALAEALAGGALAEPAETPW